MAELPNWTAAGVAAVLGFVGAWAALRVTVSSLKEDVAALKTLLLTTNTLQATQQAHAAELDRVRATGHDTRNRVQELSERIARLEAHQEGVLE